MTSILSDQYTTPGGARIARVTMDDARRLNVLDSAGIAALAGAVRAAGEDADIRAVVLTGAGARAFAGGADVGELAGLTPETAAPFITGLHRACTAIRECPVPVIARISGYCLGAGLEVAAACDLRIAAEDAVLGMPEVRLGLPSVIEAALLPRLIGWGRASWLLYTGETIAAARAYEWGLVERVVPAADLDAAVDEVVEAIASAGREAIRAQKRLMAQWETLPLADAIQRGIPAFARAYETDEPATMMQRFLERKRPAG